MRWTSTRTICAVGALVALAVTAGCGNSTAGQTSASGSAGCSVVAGFYPLQYAAATIGGDAVTVTNLTAPGVEPHDLELSPSQVAAIGKADVVLYIPGFQPAVDEAVASQAGDRAIDVTAGIDMRKSAADGTTVVDPHVWLNPANMATIGQTVATALDHCAPGSAPEIDTRYADYRETMTSLDADFRTGLANCRIRDLVVSHAAFTYLADAYGLTQVSIAGLNPDAEPSPARLKELADLVRSRGVTTVYYETLVDPKVAATLAAETGAATAVLDPLEGLPSGATGDYVTIMRANLDTLRKGQACA